MQSYNYNLRFNISILISLLLILIIVVNIDNARDQLLLSILTMTIIPVFANTINFKNLFISNNFNKFYLFTNLIIPIIYIITFVLIYEYFLFYKYSYMLQNALHDYRTYELILILSIVTLSNLAISTSILKKRIYSLTLIFFWITSISYCFFLAYHLVITELHRYNENFLNLGIVFHPIIQVFYGGTILIDIKSQYGMFPHFF